jgi:3-deoxy-D-manno-octulosonic-acid transferase
MSRVLSLLYAGTVHLVRAAAGLAPPSQHKVVRSLHARRGIRARYERWSQAHRDPARALLWMHAPSVGEGLQARPVLALARQRAPAVQLAYTFFSPSAERFAGSLAVDFRDYLPFDTGADMRHALMQLAPTALVFSKLDVWPTLVREAASRGVGLGLISATLSSGSGRRSRVADALLRSAYQRLDAVGAIDEEDAERLKELGVRPGALTVTGDTRYDQVWERAASVDRADPLLAPLRSSRPTLVAGSTWPSDQLELLAAWHSVRGRVPGARLLIAPHEPTESHLEPIERWARDARMTIDRLELATDRSDVVLIDRTGVLGALYALADVAYVGGGFHGAGLHSVLEPAAFGAPVLYGPRGNGRDARRLAVAGGRVVRDRHEISSALLYWMSDEGGRRDAGAAAREMVRQGLGAAERSWSLIRALLPGPTAPSEGQR